MAEVSRVLKRKKIAKETSNKILEFMKECSLILSLNETNAVEAAETAEREGLYLIDRIVYSYVNENNYLLTGDQHFGNKLFV